MFCQREADIRDKQTFDNRVRRGLGGEKPTYVVDPKIDLVTWKLDAIEKEGFSSYMEKPTSMRQASESALT